MKTWGYFVLASVLFVGAGVFMLRTDPVEWWSVVSATVMFVAAATFVGQAIVEFKRSDKQS